MADLSQIPTDQLVQMLQSHPAVTGNAPTNMGNATRSAWDKGSELLGGIKQGIYDIPQSAIELGLKGTDAIGLTNNRAPEVKQFIDQANSDFTPGLATSSGFTTAGRIGGQMLATAPLSELKAGAAVAKAAPGLARFGGAILPKLASGLTQGAGAAALTSNSSNAPLGQQMALGAAGGALLPLAGATVRLGGKAAAGAIGLSTGAGGASITNAFKAGLTGGDTANAFTDSMRGNTPWSQVVDDAKTALGNMRQDRNTTYRSGMADVSKDATILSFDPVDQAMNKAAAVKTFKGQDLSPKTAGVRSEVQQALDDWKALDPTEYHTPEGFDALKQKIADIRDDTDFNTPARTVADTAYNAVKTAIVKQAPAYAKVMQDYSSASDQLAALQKELSLGPKGNPNTALRKLQSVMRDNANTSWGDRAKYADTLAANGAPNLLPSLAGQALSTAIPRGLTKYADMAGIASGVGTALAGGGVAGLGTTALALPMASPRLMGEAAYGLGVAGRGVRNVGGLIGAAAPRPLINRFPAASTLGLLLPQLAASR